MTIKRRVFISSPADRHLDKRRVEVQRAIWMGSMDSVTRRRRSGPLLGQMDHADHTDTWKDPRASRPFVTEEQTAKGFSCEGTVVEGNLQRHGRS